ncbi:MAG: WecB/TagA/CpsF family glycosyltransferase [Peptococcaceae bacterium]|jgi:N-acetylglucosaminyldiphosphoundecaprenol N-acetyl-beta-D-mannosaminyltransferase|nr:WecB/TagA/CpsF family glycosyltransferase [Peptococcaceae bacterium]
MKIEILRSQVDQIDMAETAARIVAAINGRGSLRIVTANPEMIYAAARDDRLQQVINTADVVTPDGIGVVWAARRLGYRLPERVTGIDLLQQLWPLANRGKWRIFILGSQPGVAAQAIEKLRDSFPEIVWQSRHGYFGVSQEDEILRRIQDFQPDLLLAGLGSPRQEFWLARHPGLAYVSMGVGGSFDVIAGRVLRAPRWLQKMRLEWLYRLCREPKRGKRQMALPKFVWAVMKQRRRQDR